MKTKYSVLVLAAALLAGGLLTGCKTAFGKKADAALFTPTAWVTNHVEATNITYVTNVVTVAAATNAATGEVTRSTNREPVNVTINMPAHDDIKPVAWAPNETTTATISGVAGLVPGYGTLIGWGATALLGLYAQFRSGKYKDAAVSVAQGVEHYLTANPTLAPALKQTLASVQADHGTTGTVHTLLANDVETAPKA